MTSDHPHCRIGSTSGVPRPIVTDDGIVDAHRSIVHDRPLLLFHHAFPRPRATPISQAELANVRKTARRVIAMDEFYPWAGIQPLHWPRPEILHLASLDDATLFHRILADDWLIQAEGIRLLAKDSRTFLVFQRC